MEDCIGSIVNKIDIDLLKMDTMERSKQHRKDKMFKMLDDIIEDKDGDDGSVLYTTTVLIIIIIIKGVTPAGITQRYYIAGGLGENSNSTGVG